MMYFKDKILIGALTDKLYAFQNRPWELNITNTIDIFDSLGSNIKVYIYGSEVKRILPLKNDFINEDWISNKTRYFFDGLVKWRINIPLMKKLNIMSYISWIQAFYFFLLKIWFYSFFYKSQNLFFFNSIFSDYPSIITSKILIKKLGFSSFNKKANININDYYLYYLNPNFFEDLIEKKIFIFLGYNLRLEAPILNIKLRKKSIKEDVLFYTIGSIFNDNLNSILLGLNINILITYLQGKLLICKDVQKKIKTYLIPHLFNKSNFFDFNIFLIGNNILNRFDNKNIYKILGQLKKFNNIINLKYQHSSKYLLNMFLFFCQKNLPLYLIKSVNNLNVNLHVLYINLTSILYEELNFSNNVHNLNKIQKTDLVYLLGIDNFKLEKFNFVVFQGHHINSSYFNIDLILPSTTFLEKSRDFLNIEGKLVQTNFILYPPTYCRNDWSILNALYICILNFVKNVYQFNLSDTSNYFNTNRFYLPINNWKKLIYFLKKSSVNFYFEYITLSKKYFYNFRNIINLNFININKVYNSILSNKYYTPYNLDVVSEYSSVLKACGNYFHNFLRNYENINKKKKI